MDVSLASFGLLLCAFLLHVAWWRIAWPKNSSSKLLCIFMLVLAAGTSASYLAEFPADLWHHPQQVAQIILLYHAGMAAYINTYPAVEAASPSLVIADLVASRGSVSRAELERHFASSQVVLPQVQLLLNDGMVVAGSGGRYTLTSKGRAIARAFGFFRAAIGRAKGG